MASVNKVIIVGTLGKDPEVKYLPNGDAVANFSAATTEKWKDKSGAAQEHTEWHRISFFGKQAEIAGQYLKKGSQVYIEGKIKTRKWKDKEGNDRYTTEIAGDRMQFLGGKSAAHEQEKPKDLSETSVGSPKKPAGGFDEMSDDIPF